MKDNSGVINAKSRFQDSMDVVVSFLHLERNMPNLIVTISGWGGVLIADFFECLYFLTIKLIIITNTV
jgi:hypothetical protein